MPSFITLTTDFGASGPYVASVKGVILGVNPHAVIVDISHDVPPQGIEHAAFLLESVAPHFPPGTIHVAVADPGVGTSRRGISVRTSAAVYIGPDNGVLSAALPEEMRAQLAAAGPAAVGGGCDARSLENAAFHRRPVNATFHGRDIFAPVAAHLALGVPFEDVGPPLAEIVALPQFAATPLAGGALAGRILYVDRFGNLVTNVRQSQVPGPEIITEAGGRTIPGLARTYGENVGLVALIGSAGYLEIAVPGGDAARELGLSAGDPVMVRPLRA